MAESIREPKVVTLNPEDFSKVSFPSTYAEIVPNVLRQEEDELDENDIIRPLDKLTCSYVGFDGLPVLIKKKDRYLIIGGHISYALAVKKNHSIICNVYENDNFDDIIEESSLIAAIIKPILINRYCNHHKTLPKCCNNPEAEPIPYLIAAILDAYCGYDNRLFRVLPKELLQSLRMIEKLGIVKRNKLSGLKNKFRMSEKGNQGKTQLGQPAPAKLKY